MPWHRRHKNREFTLVGVPVLVGTALVVLIMVFFHKELADFIFMRVLGGPAS